MKLPVIIEVRPLVQSCWVFINTPSPQACVKLSVRPNELTVTWTEGNLKISSQTVSLPPSAPILFQPCELSAFLQEEKYMSFRVQTSPKNMTGSFSLQLVESKQDFSPSTSCAPNIPVLEECVLVCSCCDQSILAKERVIFKRVLPLPSYSYDAGDFFCHNHGDSRISADPSDSDFLYSSFGFHLHSSLLKSTAMVVRCRSCLAWIGTANASKASLWFATVNVKLATNNATLVAKLDPAKEFILTIKHAIRQCSTVVCRLMLNVKVKSDDTHYLLLNIIDRQLMLLTASSSSSAELTFHNAIKVAFHVEKSCSEIVSSWLNDSLVTTTEVALPVFTQGLKLLAETSQLIPCTHRKAQHGFLLAYLCTDFLNC